MSGIGDIIVTDIDDVYTVYSPKGRQEKITERLTYGLSFCEGGQITYTHRGKSFVSDTSHAIILPQGQTYSLYGDKSGSFPVINFSCMNILCNTMVLIPISSPEPYIKDFEKMKALSLFDGNRAKIMSIFYGIIHRLSCDNIQVPSILNPAIEYLSHNYMSHDLTNSELAAVCNISEVYFRKLFTKHFGVSPKQYIIDLRIQKAKQLLAEGAMSASAVSNECGFSNPYHFCRLFKQHTGSTPTEYRKANLIYKI